MAMKKPTKPSMSFDELREHSAKLCDGYASIVRCDRCGQIVAIVFKDFHAESDLGIDGGWTGASDENRITCEDCNEG